MKKLFLVFCCIFSTHISSLFGKKENSPLVKITFSSIRTNNQITDINLKEEIGQCKKLLNHYSTVQKARKLTFEEMRLVMQVIMFLFFQESIDYSNRVDITLENGNTITLPYSAQMFAALCQQNNDDADPEKQ
jgi:hypothetical protein